MTVSEKEEIKKSVEPLFERECEDSITLYFPGAGVYRKTMMNEISVTILRREDGTYWVVGHDAMNYIQSEETYNNDEKEKAKCDRVLERLGVKRVPEQWNGIYFETENLKDIGILVYRMLGAVLAVQWWTPLAEALTKRDLTG